MLHALSMICFVSSQKGTPFEEITLPTESPVIVILKDLHDEARDHFFIMLKNIRLHDNEYFTAALFTLLAVQYIFNI